MFQCANPSASKASDRTYVHEVRKYVRYVFRSPARESRPSQEFHSHRSPRIIFPAKAAEERWPRRRQVRRRRPSRRPPAGARGPAAAAAAPGGSSSTRRATTSSTGECMDNKHRREGGARYVQPMVFRGSFRFSNIKLSSDPDIILYCSSPRGK